MSATIIPLRRTENGGEQSSPCSPGEPTLRTSLAGALHRGWQRVRSTVEAFGWIVVAASIVAAIKG